MKPASRAARAAPGAGAPGRSRVRPAPGGFHGLLQSLLLLVAVMAVPRAATGQARTLETHTFGEPEGRLIAFYSAAMAFTPAGLPKSSGLRVAIEASLVPPLNEAQRRPSIDKPEATNLAPFLPRPRLSASWRGFAMEGSWIPPLRLFDVEANVLSASLAGDGFQLGNTRLIPRLWGVAGRVQGAITCASTSMLGKGADLEAYYYAVCHGRESDDWFEPRMLGAELILRRSTSNAAVEWYAGAGARLDRTRFDIGVITPEGARDRDHPVLQLKATRPHLVAGAAWRGTGRIGAGGELFYAPGSVLTARATAFWRAR